MRLFVLFLLTILALPAQAAWEDKPYVQLRWLDKITARTATVDLARGETVEYGALSIRLKACRAQDPLEGSDSAAFLQIWENKGDDDPQWVFSGWMFASSPGLSAMDHPIFDVWVLSCNDRKVMNADDETEEPAAPDSEADAEVEGDG